MDRSAGKTWFDSPYSGVGLSLPIAWQGWALLAAGLGGAALSLILLHGPFHTDVSTPALSATCVLIHLKRAR